MQGTFYPWNAMPLHPVWPERNHAVSAGIGIGIVRASCVFPHQNQLNRTCGINATESPTRALKIAPRRYFAFAFNIVSLSSDQMELRSIWLKKPKKKTSKHSYVHAPNTATAYQKEGPHQYGGSFLTLASESGTIVNRVPLTETL
ncbi:hypothetical protein OAY06_00055 [bacterium]|nr:hypothetical protein [bacterium]